MNLRLEHLLLAGLLSLAPAALHAQQQPAEEPGGVILRPLEEAESGAEEQAEAGSDSEAEDQPQASDESREAAVTEPGISEDVKESQPPAPNEQGMLQTETVEEEEGEAENGKTLYALLADLRRSPPGLDGQPIERPNPLASEPTPEMDPVQPLDAYLFPDGYVE